MAGIFKTLADWMNGVQKPLVSPLPNDKMAAMQRYAQQTQPTPQPSNPPVFNQLAPQYKKLVQTYVPPQSQEDAAKVLHHAWWNGLKSPEDLAYSLATVKAETADSFKPVREGQFNDEKYGYPEGFTGKKQAEKRGYKGGSDYYGRGYIQLTHDYNYKKYGDRLGVDLEKNPELALDPDISAKIFALYMADHKGELESSLSKGKLASARRVVNGGVNGLQDVNGAYKTYLKTLKSGQ